MSSIQRDITRPALLKLIGTPALSGAHRCPDRRRFCRGTLVWSRLVQRRPLRLRSIGAARLRDKPSSRSASVATSCSEGVAAWLRHAGLAAEVLEGGFEAWRAAGIRWCPTDKLPAPRSTGPNGLGDARAAEDRPHRLPLADPPLRRSGRRVPVRCAARSAGRRRAIRCDAVRHRGRVLEPSRRACTFDTMIAEFGLTTEPLIRLATIVRGADTARPDLAPEAAGLLAASLGLSRMYADDLEQLDAGMLGSTTRSIAGAATPPTKPTTGRPPSPNG